MACRDRRDEPCTVVGRCGLGSEGPEGVLDWEKVCNQRYVEAVGRHGAVREALEEDVREGGTDTRDEGHARGVGRMALLYSPGGRREASSDASGEVAYDAGKHSVEAMDKCRGGTRVEKVVR